MSNKAKVKKIKESLLTHKEVCEALKIKPQTLYNWVQKGFIKPVKIGQLSRYKIDDVKSLVKTVSPQ